MTGRRQEPESAGHGRAQRIIAAITTERLFAFAAGCCTGVLLLLAWYGWFGVSEPGAPQQDYGLLAVVPALVLLLLLGAAARADTRNTLCVAEEHPICLDAILDLSNDAVILIDGTNRIVRVNQAAAWMFGYLEENVRGIHVAALLPELDRPQRGWGDEPERNARRPPNLRRETAGTHQDGHSFPVEVLVKPLPDGAEARSLVLVRDIEEQRSNQLQLRFLQQNDPVTGLLNRSEFEKQLAARLALSDPADGSLFLCYADVEQFKLINDSCGYAAGNESLRQLAILLQSQLKNADLLGRLGGDEFGALLSGVSTEAAQDQCQGLLQTVSSFLFAWGDQSFDLELSLGLAELAPHAETGAQAIARAEAACHNAMGQGRGHLYLSRFSEAPARYSLGDTQLASTINRALHDGRFRLVAHPMGQVAKDRWGESPHYEILVRMLDEQGALLEPSRFMPAAERYLLMPAVDRWVISELFRHQASNLRRWAAHSQDFLFSVNLSGMSLADKGFLSFIKRQFCDWQVPQSTICFEITETAAIANLERAQHLIRELRAAGCKFALDDFGSGLSSYMYLQELPVDLLKIDGRFVRTVADDRVSLAIVDSINQIGHILGLTTVAEWVENDAILDRVRDLNIDLAQGQRLGPERLLDDIRLPSPLSDSHVHLPPPTHDST